MTEQQLDARDLLMLKMFTSGQRVSQIACNLAISPHTARRRIAMIREADCRYDPEANHYWRPEA